VGDLLIIKQDDDIPADLILVDASNDAYISTGSLDGEKNLKPKFRIKDISSEF
jgi:P-type E1-E2 ATPase